MSGSLDMPQHILVCKDCGAREADAVFCSCPVGVATVEPTLTYADFETYVIATSPWFPDPLEVWDYLESHTDTAVTNREAIENAIAAVTGEARPSSMASEAAPPVDREALSEWNRTRPSNRDPR